MTIQEIRNQLPEYAKDIKLNLGTVLTEDGAPDLSLSQIYGVALATAYSTKHPQIIEAVEHDSGTVLTDTEINAAKAAATIMGMNNIYYRFVHLSGDKEFLSMPASLRMNVINGSGVAKVDFELYSLAVSAINGCGMCIESHAKSLEKEHMSKKGIQSAIRIAAVINAVAQVLVIEKTSASSGNRAAAA